MIHYLPVALNLIDKDVLIVGAGVVGTQKVDDLMGCGARVHVVSPVASRRVQDLAAAGEIQLELRKFQPGDTDGAFLVMVATDDREANVAAYNECAAAGRLVNVCDDPPLCNFIFTSKIERGPLTISIYTHGTSPAFSKRVRRELEQVLGPEYAEMAELLAALRPRIMAIPGLTQPQRQRIFERVIYSEVLYLLREGEREAALQKVEEFIQQMVQVPEAVQ